MGESEFDFGYTPAIERLRIILMFFVCINVLGFPSSIGGLIQTLSGFAPLAFFIISGFLVLRESPNRSKRILRAIKRTAIVFAILAVVYFFINFFFYMRLGISPEVFFGSLKNGKLWFDFLVMNSWPYDIGGAIWYVQALLYAYIIIFFMDKLKLLKYDWWFAIIFLVLAIFTGELSGLFQWNLMGYTYVNANFLTRAMPYVLIGSFLSKKREKLRSIPVYSLACGIVLGIGLSYAELYLLAQFNIRGYSYSHLLGMGVMAVSACLIAFNQYDYEGFESFFKMSRFHTNLIYYMCQPMGVGIAIILSLINTKLFTKYRNYIGIATFVLCFLIAWLVAFIYNKFFCNNPPVTIKLAGIPIEIHPLYDSLPGIYNYITEDEPSFSIKMNKKDIDFELQKSIEECQYEGIPYQEYTREELENTAIYRKIADKLPEYNALVFHGSCVAVDGRAYLFTAKSGTGKTTHTDLWLENIPNSYVINGDKPILRVQNGTAYVSGTPWMGKEGYGRNETLPLSAICIVNRGETNEIKKTDFKSVYPKLIGQAYRPQNGPLVAKTVKILELITANVPIYELYCNMDDEAAFVAYNGMKND